MSVEIVFLYCFVFLLPNLAINLLQYRHISKAMQQKPILLSSSDYIQAGNCVKAKLRLSIVQEIFGAGLFVFWIFFGLAWLNEIIPSFFVWDASDSVFIVIAFSVLSQVFSLPFRYCLEMVLDKKYGFSHQSFSLFVMDFFKGIALILLLGAAILYGLVYLMDTFELWWLWSAIFIFAVVVVINFLYPTLIAPLFNAFTPLADEELKEKIDTLLEKVGFESRGVFVMDASKRDGRLNAYFGGFGRSKRVVLFDTLLDKISTEGLLAILGHELGHFKNGDIWRNLCIQALFLFCVFFAAGSLPQGFFDALDLQKNSGNLIVILMLFAPVVSFWLLPLIGYFLRRAEFGADAFGASLTSKRALAEALVRLVNENKSFPSSHPCYIFFCYTHPPLLQRLKALDYEV